MKIISLWNPWAVLWAGGAKKIETRGKNWFAGAELPLWVAVHAAKRFTQDEIATCCQPPHFTGALLSLGYKTPGDLPLGAVVGLVRIVKIYQFTPANSPPLYPERAFGDFGLGRYGYVTDRNLMFETPIPLRGQQGTWEWTRPPDAKLVDRLGVPGVVAAPPPAAPTLFGTDGGSALTRRT